MKHQSSGLSVLAVAGMLGIMIGAASAQEKSKYPDWSGQWTWVPDGGQPRYDMSKPLRQQEAPLKPEYQARFEASIKDQDEGGMGLDLAYSCRPPGMPRMMTGVARMEFLIAPGVTHILFDRKPTTTMASSRSACSSTAESPASSMMR